MDSEDYVPVTDLLARASAQLGVGELLQTDNFSLFEAMSAIEIGNIKMDAGAAPKLAEVPQEYPLQTQPSQGTMIAIMDSILSLEATWHTGPSLAQTVYCSHYMMQQDRLAKCLPLAAFCQAVQVLCLETNHLIYQGCVCEEEDFNIHTGGLPLEYMALTSSSSSSSKSSSGGKNSSGKNSGSGSSSGATCLVDQAVGAISQAVDSLGGQHQQSSPAAAALASRLQFHKLLLQALVRLQQRTKPDLDAAAKLLQKARTELAAVKASAGLGQSGDLGVDPGLNSHLTPAVPMRVVEFQTTDQAFDHFDRLLGQLLRVTRVTGVTSWPSLRGFLEDFSVTQPHVLARSALFLQLNTNPPTGGPPSAAAPPAPAGPTTSSSNTSSSSGTTPATSSGAAAAGTAGGALQQQHLQPAWMPAEAMLRGAVGLEQGIGLGPEVDTFLEQAQIAASNYCQAMLMNPARQRRRLRKILEDWHNLFHHGANADVSGPLEEYLTGRGWEWGQGQAAPEIQGPLATWVEAEMCSIIAQHLLAGFALDLYEAPDYIMITWYCDFLFATRHQLRALLTGAWQRAGKAAAAGAAAAAAAAAAAGKKGGGAGGKGGKAAAGLPGLGPKPKKGAGNASSSSTSSSSGAAAGQKSPVKPGSSSSSHAAAAAGGSTTSVWASPDTAAKAAAALQDIVQSPHSLQDAIVCEVVKNMCLGTTRLVLALQQLGLLALPSLQFNSEQQRYDLRFSSLYGLAKPDPLLYEHYVESMSVTPDMVPQLLSVAAQCYKQARNAVLFLKSRAETLGTPQQLLDDMASLERVAGQNAVAAGLLARTSGKGMAAQFACSSCHPAFPSVSLKSGAGGGSGRPAAAAAAAAGSSG